MINIVYAYCKHIWSNTTYNVISAETNGMGGEIKAEKDWRGVERPQVAMHSQLPRFLVFFRIFAHVMPRCDFDLWSLAKIRKIINNSAGDCSILLKFSYWLWSRDAWYKRTFKVNGSKVKVTAWHYVSASKNAIIQAGVRCRRSNFVKIIPEPSATCNTMFKVIRSNTESAITPPRIARLRSNLVQSFITSRAIHCKCSRPKLKGKGQRSKARSQHKVMYQQL